MATIQPRPGRKGTIGYRVQIRLKGVRASATFPTLAEARRWAYTTEGAIRSRAYFPPASSS